jgi:putative oxidoreductase
LPEELVAVGLLTPLAAAVLCSVMLVAAISVHIKKGFFVTSGGYEYTLVLGVAALTLAFTGPGALSLDALSLDALVGHYLSGTLWGGGAFLVGVLGGVVALVRRRPIPTHQSATDR